ncbi:SGNH/GDSL hydrolase family protein [Paenibacillus sp. GCM10027628]|uniref:SGNH/GDSL hydrolase family protein n=1 Tax=Paenibacillus sp. GCM10027628 TaxID=3273413 RepID=UPI003637DB79
MRHFERFHRRLLEKAENASARAVTYVALGDSVTQGCMQDGIIEYESVYHHVCKRRIEQRYMGTVLNMINSGIAGDTAAASRSRWERDVLLYKPDLVSIFFGHNDAHGGKEGIAPYIQAISDFVDLIRAETEADIVVITPCMMMKRDNVRIAEVHKPLIPQFVKLAEEGHLLSYTEALRQFAWGRGIPCLDAYGMWERMEREGIDIHARLSNGINHPDPEFHVVLGAALEKTLFHRD